MAAEAASGREAKAELGKARETIAALQGANEELTDKLTASREQARRFAKESRGVAFDEARKERENAVAAQTVAGRQQVQKERHRLSASLLEVQEREAEVVQGQEVLAQRFERRASLRGDCAESSTTTAATGNVSRPASQVACVLHDYNPSQDVN